MKNQSHIPVPQRWLFVLAMLVAGGVGATDISTTPLNTYSATSSTDVKPNVLFILDDSGSMAWDYMPDNSNTSDQTLKRNNAYNGLAYNPAITYKPPTAVDSSGVANTTTYPNQDGTSSTKGGNGSATSGSPNWSAVKNDAYGVQSTSTTSLTPSSSSAPYFYVTVPGEYCTLPSQRSCTTATSSSTSYPYPATVRWCNSGALTTCQATYDSATSFTNARYPLPRTATITVSGSSSTSVSGITVDGQQILSATATASSTSSTVAQNIVNQINACTFLKAGNCTIVGYQASLNSSTVTITAPVAFSTNTVSPVVTIGNGGTMSFNTTAFAQGTIPGDVLRVTITPGITSYPYPGTNAKASTRTDCAGTTCTYNEEMTNYANWYTYYRTRMQMMKTAASNAFAGIDTAADIAAGKSRFRLGYMSINNNTGTDFVNLDQFTGTQKGTWYSKLTSANPSNSTPLRVALSNAGRLYAGKLNGTTFNGVTVTDPLQYSCQQNYTILSTDGFWNSGAGFKMDGSTAVGNQDGGKPAPYGDGGTVTIQTRTSTLQTAPVSSQYQYRNSYLQQRTTATLTAPSIQTRTSSDSGNTWTAWSDVSSCTVDNSGSSRRQCQFPKSTSSDGGVTWSAWFYASSCTVDNIGSSRTACSGSVTTTTAWTNVSSCTVASGVECQYTAWGSWTNSSSCTAVPQTASSPYTVGTATQCQTTGTITGTWTNATGTCVATSSNSCQYTSWGGWSTVASCTAIPQSTGPTYTVLTARQCQTISSGGTSDTLADVADYYYNTDLRSPTAADGTGTCTGPIISPATTPNDLCANNVPVNGRDVARTQHMTTFTLGLGEDGKMVYAPTDGVDPWNDTTGDFASVKNAVTASPSTGICTWQATGTCVWPTPASDSNANIDDLWHAAINGRGTYFSAKNPANLTSGLTRVLAQISNTPRPGTAAAAASSNPNVSSTDNFVFSSSYQSVTWYGELVRQRINTNGTLTAQNWSAMRLLDCATTTWTANKAYVAGDVYRQGTSCYVVLGDYTAGASFDGTSTGIDFLSTRVLNEDEAASSPVAVTAPTSRTIYFNGGSGLVSFTYNNLTSASKNNEFTKSFLANSSGTPRLSQFCASGIGCLSSADQTSASTTNLVNYLRGDRTYEGTYYRARTHVLGDIVASEARYVKQPLFNYTDAGYAAFKTAKASRTGMVYVGANDGMVHAFDATTGKEVWAFIPSKVLPNMYQLADKNYSSNHQFFVDNTPEVGEFCVPATSGAACTSSDWKTVLIGGLNRGGNGYYALDITNPASPSLLWEFTDSHMGYTYGNPRVTKLKDGTWVALLTSGYNNDDGKGYMYVVKMSDGSLVRTITTNTGSVGTPSGLARIAAHVLLPDTNNTTVAAYAGDTLGNMWRFDINGDIGASGYDAQLLITVQNAAGAVQPITAKPTVATVNGETVVYFGTGRYLGVSDIADTALQSFYAIKDKSDSNTLLNPRSNGSNFVQQVMTSTTCPADAASSICTQGQIVRTMTSNAVDWSTKNGWYVDFLSAGERAATDPTLGLGTLLFTTNQPSLPAANACGDPSDTTARSFIYALDYKSGGAVVGASTVGGVSLGDGAVTRPVLIELADGTVRSLTRVSSGSGGSSGGTDLGTTVVGTPPVNIGAGSGLRRVSWRELTTQ